MCRSWVGGCALECLNGWSVASIQPFFHGVLICAGFDYAVIAGSGRVSEARDVAVGDGVWRHGWVVL